MRNLVLTGELRRKVPIEGDDEISGLCPLSDSSVVLTRNGILTRLARWRVDLREHDEAAHWFHVSFVDPADAIVCISRNGAVVSVSPETGEAELVGVFDNGVHAASLSRDGEALLLVTEVDDDDEDENTHSVLMTLNSQFEVLAEVRIEDFDASFPVSATWRPDGRWCAVSAVDASDGMRKVRVYARESLDVQAVGLAEDASGKLVKNLDASAALSWAGAGCSQLLASVQKKSKRVTQVVFFEPNGLRHGEFDLRQSGTIEILGLCWSPSSDLLCVTLRNELDGFDMCQMWHRSNYHWYLKQEFRFRHEQYRILGTLFRQGSAANELCVLLTGMEWREYEFFWDASTVCETVSGACFATVIDGTDLKMTNLAQALVPPPMSQASVAMECPIREVAFCEQRKVSDVFSVVLLSNGNLSLIGQGDSGFHARAVRWTEKQNVDMQSLRSMQVISSADASSIRAIAVLCADGETSEERIAHIRVDLNNDEPTASVLSSTDAGGRVLRCCSWLDSDDGALIQLRDGSFMEYNENKEDSLLKPLDVDPFLEPCPRMMAIKNISKFIDSTCDPDQSVGNQNMLIVGLSARSRLYAQDLMLTDSASSFTISTSHRFLTYVTAGSQCEIRFLPFAEIVQFDPFLGADQNHIFVGYEPRSVERGARLVAVPPSKPMAVLQMPRGNLEGIYPRALVVGYVLRQIAETKYTQAFELMRRQKIDTNLIVDVDPWHFLDVGIRSVFDQIESIDHLNLFISALCNWNVTQSRFSIPNWLQPKLTTEKRGDFDFSTKVNQICQKARALMTQMEQNGETPSGRKVQEGHFLLPILSTFAREHPPQLEQALGLVKSNALKHHQGSSSRSPPLFSETAQSSIQYLAFLAEYNSLFETALGMYDFDLARAVARNSQMDPKKYLPLLKRLKSLPPNYARYEVDVRLQRNEAALENLVKSLQENETMESDIGATVESILSSTGEVLKIENTFEDCRALVKTNNLYRLGLELLGDDAERRQIIMLDLGEHLLAKGQDSTALSVFMSLDPPDTDGAIRAARSSGNWRSLFALMDDATEGDVGKMRMIAQEVAEKVVSLVSTASHSEKSEAHASAARILLDYADDVDGAVDMLLTGELWDECYRITKLRRRPVLTKKCVEAAVEHAAEMVADLDGRVEQFREASEKFAATLAARKEKILSDGPLDEGETTETGSLFSSASNMSNTSVRSNVSASSTGSSMLSINTSATTFTMTGKDATDRHRSKFNHGAKKKKPKKPRKPKRTKIQPGSPEALQEAFGMLKSGLLDPRFGHSVETTVLFLLRRQKTALARRLYDAYVEVEREINKIQEARISNAKNESGLRSNEFDARSTQIQIEEEAATLRCHHLPKSVHEFFELVPPKAS